MRAPPDAPPPPPHVGASAAAFDAGGCYGFATAAASAQCATPALAATSAQPMPPMPPGAQAGTPCGASPLPSPPLLQQQPGQLLAAFDRLPPAQRAAIDQALFFGLDLRTATQLLGQARPDAASAAGGRRVGVGSSSSAAGAGGAASSGAGMGQRHPGSADGAGSPDGGLRRASLPGSSAAACSAAGAATSSSVAGPYSASASGGGAQEARGAEASGLEAALAHVQLELWALLEKALPTLLPTLLSRLPPPLTSLAKLLGRTPRATVSLVTRVAGRVDDLMGRLVEWLQHALLTLVERPWRALLGALERGGCLTQRQAAALLGAVLRAAVPPARRAYDQLEARVHAARRHRSGVWLTNVAGVAGAASSARMVVVGGPLLGRLMYLPMRLAWVYAFSDLRVAVVCMLLTFVGLIKAFTRLGWID